MQEVGLQGNRGRWYDPETNTWISEDPKGFDAGDSNLERYLGNDPLNATDPSGLKEQLTAEQKAALAAFNGPNKERLKQLGEEIRGVQEKRRVAVGRVVAGAASLNAGAYAQSVAREVNLWQQVSAVAYGPSTRPAWTKLETRVRDLSKSLERNSSVSRGDLETFYGIGSAFGQGQPATQVRLIKDMVIAAGVPGLKAAAGSAVLLRLQELRQIEGGLPRLIAGDGWTSPKLAAFRRDPEPQKEVRPFLTDEGGSIHPLPGSLDWYNWQRDLRRKRGRGAIMGRATSFSTSEMCFWGHPGTVAVPSGKPSTWSVAFAPPSAASEECRCRDGSPPPSFAP